MNNLKAYLAALAAGLSVMLGDLRGADDALTLKDWVIVVLAAAVAGVGAYLIPPTSNPRLRTPKVRRRA